MLQVPFQHWIFTGRHEHSSQQVSHIWGNFRGQHIRSAMDEPQRGKSTFMTMLSPLPGKDKLLSLPGISLSSSTHYILTVNYIPSSCVWNCRVIHMTLTRVPPFGYSVGILPGKEWTRTCGHRAPHLHIPASSHLSFFMGSASWRNGWTGSTCASRRSQTWSPTGVVGNIFKFLAFLGMQRFWCGFLPKSLNCAL